MRNPLTHWTTKSALFLAISIAAAGVARAQATMTATRGAEIAPFVQTTLISPDWGPTNNLGYTIGVDYTRLLQSIVQPSLEVRFTNANGNTVSERSFTGGLRIGTTIGAIHPYATVLAGTGVITFTHPIQTYTSDTSFVYAIGGGLEFNVRPSWKLRADFSQQQWNLNPHQLTPMIMSVGIAYRIPFHKGGWEH